MTREPSAVLNRMKPLDDGTLLLLGALYEGDVASGYLAKIDERGARLWDRTFRSVDSSSNFSDAIAIDGGGYVITGWLEWDILVMKLSAEPLTPVPVMRGVPWRLDLW